VRKGREGGGGALASNSSASISAPRNRLGRPGLSKAHSSGDLMAGGGGRGATTPSRPTRTRSGELTPMRPPSVVGLQENLQVLFVDDDLMVRKVFSKACKTIAPTWKVTMVTNGEDALQLSRSTTYDVIFMDHYMKEKLLGTGVIAALRERGTKSIICGMSNTTEKEAEFLKAGADYFVLKPIPGRALDLRREFIRLGFGAK
jgi:CheY-like chemotaxis protein